MMVNVKRIVLDVLKPHHPNGLEFASSIAEKSNARVLLTVTEVDEQTETVVLELEGDNLQYDMITQAISDLGASTHSIDGVMVESEPDQDETQQDPG